MNGIMPSPMMMPVELDQMNDGLGYVTMQAPVSIPAGCVYT